MVGSTIAPMVVTHGPLICQPGTRPGDSVSIDTAVACEKRHPEERQGTGSLRRRPARRHRRILGAAGCRGTGRLESVSAAGRHSHRGSHRPARPRPGDRHRRRRRHQHAGCWGMDISLRRSPARRRRFRMGAAAGVVPALHTRLHRLPWSAWCGWWSWRGVPRESPTCWRGGRKGPARRGWPPS